MSLDGEWAVLFLDDRRTVVITAEANGSFTYRSFDHARHPIPVDGRSSIATATVRGGRLIRSPPGSKPTDSAPGHGPTG